MKECERLKKLLSANAQSMPINAENLKDDIDFSSKLNRAEFEVISLVKRFISLDVM